MPTTYAIPDGRTVMAVTLWTGNSTTGRAITGVGFAPDFAWIKNRSVGYSNNLTDTVRGATKLLFSNSTDAEATTPIHGYIGAFTSDGYTLTNGSSTNGYVNDSGSNYVGWNWKAGGTAVSNTAGSITSSVSANTTAGFSVVTYTGTGANATVGHGLGVAPSMMIVKNRSAAEAWDVYHVSIGATGRLFLNRTDATNTSIAPWNNTAPTSTVFSLGTGTETNQSASLMLAYCFAAVAGYSAFGSYTGNGSADGPFIYTGFRPRWLMTKRTDSSTSGDWNLVDTSRGTYNAVGPYLYANLSNAEGNAAIYDILSNGFKIRETGAGTNASGSTYIYAAFAETAFKFSNAR